MEAHPCFLTCLDLLPGLLKRKVACNYACAVHALRNWELLLQLKTGESWCTGCSVRKLLHGQYGGTAEQRNHVEK